MAEEDLIFGKNRHFFGGIEPSNMIEFTVSYDVEDTVRRSKVVAKLPADTTINGQTLCSVAGAVIRKKVGAYPKDEFDGILVKNISTDETFYDENVEVGNTYYYAAFPYTTQGVYNRNAANRFVCTIIAGYEPDNMKAFTATSAYYNKRARVRLNAILPDNGTEDRPYTVAGAIIRRKTTGYPMNETDGTLVKDLKESGEFYDTRVSLNQVYYYAAFPYTTQGVYNRNAANRASCTPVAVTIGNMQVFTAKSIRVDGQPRVVLTATLPANTADYTIAGAVIRRSTSGYPANESDGEQVATITANGTYYDTNVEVGITYYYTAFPYSTDGVYNTNGASANHASCKVDNYGYLFGYDLTVATTSPSNRVTYPSDVDNANFTPAAMDFSTKVFNYGDWSFEPGEMFMPRPCMLTSAGVVAYYLNPDDYTKKTDGTASEISDMSFDGNAMVEWPKIWTKRWEENGIYHFRCSDVQIDEDYECWSNYDRLNNQIDHFYTPIFYGTTGTSMGTKLRSISGRSNMTSKSASEEITLATANGDDWYTEVLADRLLIQDLLVMMAKSTDGQAAYGNGRISKSDSESQGDLSTGTMNRKGMFWGSNDNTSGVKVFGMEHLWGNLWRRIAGWINASGNQKVKLTRGTHDGSTATDYNLDGNGYLTVSGATPTGSSGGYINAMKTMPYGRIPYQASGSSSTFEADSLEFNNNQSDYAFVGGAYNTGGLQCGPFCALLTSTPSVTYFNRGAALSCKPCRTNSSEEGNQVKGGEANGVTL